MRGRIALTLGAEIELLSRLKGPERSVKFLPSLVLISVSLLNCMYEWQPFVYSVAKMTDGLFIRCSFPRDEDRMIFLTAQLICVSLWPVKNVKLSVVILI